MHSPMLSTKQHIDCPFSTAKYFWRVIDAAGVAMGFKSLFSKVKLPALLMTVVGYICAFIGWVIGRKLRVNPFTVRDVAPVRVCVQL